MKKTFRCVSRLSPSIVRARAPRRGLPQRIGPISRGLVRCHWYVFAAFALCRQCERASAEFPFSSPFPFVLGPLLPPGNSVASQLRVAFVRQSALFIILYIESLFICRGGWYWGDGPAKQMRVNGLALRCRRACALSVAASAVKLENGFARVLSLTKGERCLEMVAERAETCGSWRSERGRGKPIAVVLFPLLLSLSSFLLSFSTRRGIGVRAMPVPDPRNDQATRRRLRLGRRSGASRQFNSLGWILADLRYDVNMGFSCRFDNHVQDR